MTAVESGTPVRSADLRRGPDRTRAPVSPRIPSRLPTLLSLIALLFGVAALPGAAARAQDDDAGLIIPVDDESRRLLGEAQEAREAGDFTRAAEIYRKLLEERGGGVVPVGDDEETFRGVAPIAEDGLRALPPEGLEVYRQRVESKAKKLLDDAVAARDLFAVATVADRYPFSAAGDEACRTLGDLAFERGDFGRARWYYDRILSRFSDADAGPAEVRDRASRAVDLDHAPGETERAKHVNPTPNPVWNHLAAKGATQTPPWSQHFFHGYRSRREPVRRSTYFHPNLPVVKDGTCYIAGPVQLSALDVDTGRNVNFGPSGFQPSRLTRFADENPQALYTVAVDDERVYGSFVSEVDRGENFHGGGGFRIEIKAPIPIRKIMAFDPRSARKLWDLAESDDPFIQKSSFPAPPIVAGGAVYAPATKIEGYIQVYLCAFNPRDGQLLWKTLLGSGQVETTMFVYYAREPLASPAAEEGGVLYQCTNIGLVAAVRAEDGAILWESKYETIPIEAARHFQTSTRMLGWGNNPPLVVGDRVLFAPLDSDYLYAFDKDTGEFAWRVSRKESPRPYPHEWDLRYVLGEHEGRVLVSGRSAAAIRAEDGKIAWIGPDIVDEIGMQPAGRGAVVGDMLVVPAKPETSRDGYLLTTDLRTGKSKEEIRFRKSDMGNFIATDDMLIISAPGEVRAFKNLPPSRRSEAGESSR